MVHPFRVWDVAPLSSEVPYEVPYEVPSGAEDRPGLSAAVPPQRQSPHGFHRFGQNPATMPRVPVLQGHDRRSGKDQMSEIILQELSFFSRGCLTKPTFFPCTTLWQCAIPE